MSPMSGSAPAGTPSIDSGRGSVATFSTWLKSLKVKVSGSWAARSRAVALSASRAVITVSAMVILIGVSSTSMTLRQILPGWDALSVHPTEASPAPGPRSPGRHERDGATQLPVRCSTASGVASCAADEPVTTRLEVSPRPWQGPRHRRCQRRRTAHETHRTPMKLVRLRGGRWHASSSPVPPAG